MCLHGQLCRSSSLQELTKDQPLGCLLTLNTFSSRHAKLTFPELTLPNSLQTRSPSFEGWGHADPKLRKEAAPLGEEGPALAPCDPSRAEFILSWSMVSNEDFKLELRGEMWVSLEKQCRPISFTTYKIQPSVALSSSVPAHPLLYVKKNFYSFWPHCKTHGILVFPTRDWTHASSTGSTESFFLFFWGGGGCGLTRFFLSWGSGVPSKTAVLDVLVPDGLKVLK